MALPTSGQLSYSEINVELGNGSTSEASMLAMATAASLPTTNASVSNFYGYSSGVVASWSNLGTPTPTSTWFQQWRYLSLAGLGAATIKVQITNNLTFITGGGGAGSYAAMYWYISTISSPPVGSYAGTSVGSRISVGSTSYYVPTSGYVGAPPNYLMVKQSLAKSNSGNSVIGNFTITLSYLIGSGSISGYSLGTSLWQYNF